MLATRWGYRMQPLVDCWGSINCGKADWYSIACTVHNCTCILCYSNLPMWEYATGECRFCFLDSFAMHTPWGWACVACRVVVQYSISYVCSVHGPRLAAVLVHWINILYCIQCYTCAHSCVVKYTKACAPVLVNNLLLCLCRMGGLL